MSSNNLKAWLDEIRAEAGEPTSRRGHGFWVPFGWATRALVEKGYGVTEAVRLVLHKAGERVDKESVACVRVTYYKVKKRPWPRGSILGQYRGGVNPESVVEPEIEEPEPDIEEEEEIDDSPMIVPSSNPVLPPSTERTIIPPSTEDFEV